MLFSTILLSSKKHLRLKCSQCRRLLPSAHFGSLSAPSHALCCLTCKPLCVVCGIRKPISYFSEGATYTETKDGNITDTRNSSNSSSSSTSSSLMSDPHYSSSGGGGNYSPIQYQSQGNPYAHFSSTSPLSACSTSSQHGLCVCNGCLAKTYVAKTNVYFRYPVLKYRSCPFSTEEYRKKLLDSNPNK